MQSRKLSISLPEHLFEFIENYLTIHPVRNRTEVIKEALHLLEQKELEISYTSANQEIDFLYENTIWDGIEEDSQVADPSPEVHRNFVG